jgi:hypothetical protein
MDKVSLQLSLGERLCYELNQGLVNLRRGPGKAAEISAS